MSDYVRITDRKIEMTDEGVEALMSDYTPTTEEVRACASLEYRSEASVITEAEFDRWLAEVKAQAWEAGWDADHWPKIIKWLDEKSGKRSMNPYRQGETE